MCYVEFDMHAKRTAHSSCRFPRNMIDDARAVQPLR